MATATATKTLVTGYYLENQMPGHNKFYTVLIAEDGTVLTNWGRIGAAGQTKCDKMPSSRQAEEVGLRQFYAKSTKGYKVRHEAVKFEVDQKALNDANAGNATALLSTWRETRMQPLLATESQVALRHYEDFAKKAQQLLEDAPNLDFETLYARHSELVEVWGALTDKHAEVSAIVDLTKATLMRKLTE